MKLSCGFHPAAMLLPCMVFILSLSCSIAWAGGPVYGAKAGGMGTAFCAVADDGSAIPFNPAGLVNVKGAQVYGGAVGVMPSTRYENPEGRLRGPTSRRSFHPISTCRRASVIRT